MIRCSHYPKITWQPGTIPGPWRLFTTAIVVNGWCHSVANERGNRQARSCYYGSVLIPLFSFAIWPLRLCVQTMVMTPYFLIIKCTNQTHYIVHTYILRQYTHKMPCTATCTIMYVHPSRYHGCLLDNSALTTLLPNTNCFKSLCYWAKREGCSVWYRSIAGRSELCLLYSHWTWARRVKRTREGKGRRGCRQNAWWGGEARHGARIKEAQGWAQKGSRQSLP